MNSIVFFGTDTFSTITLDELKKVDILPSLIVTAPDRPKGRKLILTPPPVKVWAQEHKIKCIQPERLSADLFTQNTWDLFIVSSYGKIIPQNILDLPIHKTINVHPSLLPKLRGASPVQSAILFENETGVSIMRIDEKMDHGPIIAQEKYTSENWPLYGNTLEKNLAHLGGKLLAETIPKWISGSLQETPQDHTKATYTKKITKEDGHINLQDDADTNLRKIKAYSEWPKAYFFAQRHGTPIRVIIKDAYVQDDILHITRVLPEGRSEMNYQDFLKGNTK